ncbi:MAG TPA: RidA family protein [Burkholderiales bacterium]|jgi:enamine deaminase RidA (YjgF/YER057c/UK114 family)
MKPRPVHRRAHASSRQAAAGKTAPQFRVRYSCPSDFYDPKSYSHVVEVEGGRLLFVSGQVPVNAQRQLASREFREQVERVYDNLETVLKSVGAGFQNVVKTTNYLTDIAQAKVFREVRDARFAHVKTRPASTTLVITSLVEPEFLLEIEVVAAVPAR